MSKEAQVVHVDVQKAGTTPWFHDQQYKAVVVTNEGKTGSHTSTSKEHAIKVAADRAKR